MNTREFWANEAAKVRDTSALFSHNDVALGREALNVSVSKPEEKDTTQCIGTWSITEISDVRSIEAEELIIYPWPIPKGQSGPTTLTTLWVNVRIMYDSIKKHIADDMTQGSAAEKKIISKFNDDWMPWNQVVNSLEQDSSFKPQEYSAEGEYKAALAQHTELVKQLKSSQVGGFKERINSFQKAIANFVDNVVKYKDEINPKHGYQRFDELYKKDALVHILAAIPYVQFTPAEVKALQMTETGDFTNAIIAGIEGKIPKKGIRSDKNTSGKGIVGICQLPNDEKDNSADEARNWINNNAKVYWANRRREDSSIKVELPSVTNDRTNTRNAVYLTAGYFGRIVEILHGDFRFAEIKDCLDMKRAVFLSYNAGPAIVKDAINTFYQTYGGVENLSWSNSQFMDILNARIDKTYKPLGSSDEKKTYVGKIERRLTMKVE